MGILATNFNKVLYERGTPAKKEKSDQKAIAQHVKIENIEKSVLKAGKSTTPILKVHFLFTVHYEPGIATILLEGDLHYHDKAETVEEVARVWKKDKKISDNILNLRLTQHIYQAALMEAIAISRIAKLPPPFKMPEFKLK